MVKDNRGRTLTDLRLSLTDRCNLRCTYCMPKEIFGSSHVFLKKSQWLEFSELDELVEAFIKLGVRKVRLTGGEPLLRPGVSSFIQRLKEIHKIDDVALTTNGVRLNKHAKSLKNAGLERITISLDALDPEIAGKMNGLGVSPKFTLAGIEAALDLGFIIKVNMVVEKGVNESQILPMAHYFKDRGVILRFIEFMDVGNHNKWSIERVVSGSEILNRMRSEFDVEPIDLSSSQEVAKRYRYLDGSCEFGLITSVTQTFCGNCTRARISADGKLFTCLFSNNGLDLKTFLRSKEYNKSKLLNFLSKHWIQRDDRYSELRSEIVKPGKKVEMSYIGG